MLTVLADDLTGACDVASELVTASGPIAVFADMTRIGSRPPERLVINSQSRAAGGDEAYEKVRNIAALFRTLGSDLIFKKVDTLLRGNFARELDAVFDEYGSGIAIVAPAYPAYGRTTVDGRQLIDGVPAEQTDFADDPFTPVTKSSIREVLAPRAVASVGLDTVRGSDLTDAFEKLVRDGKSVIIADATEDDDLSRICEAALRLPRPLFLVGSLGLAAAYRRVATVLKPAGRAKFDRRGPTLLVAGSKNTRCIEQVDYAARTLGVRLVKIDQDSAQNDDRAREAKDELASGRDVALIVDADAVGLDPRSVEVVLADLTKKIVESSTISALALVGGETAYRIAMSLGIESIDVFGKIEDAVPVGRIRGGILDGVLYVSKGGGVGGVDVIASVLRHLGGN